MHTIYVVMLGFLLLVVFLLAGHALGYGRQAALYFLPAWLAGAAINMWLGVSRAGYSVRDEAPIFLLVFAIPSALALVAWWKLPNDRSPNFNRAFHDIHPERSSGLPLF